MKTPMTLLKNWLWPQNNRFYKIFYGFFMILFFRVSMQNKNVCYQLLLWTCLFNCALFKSIFLLVVHLILRDFIICQESPQSSLWTLMPLASFPLSVIPRILTKKSHKTAHITKKKRDDKKIEVTLLLHSPILNHFQSCLSHSAFKSCRLLAWAHAILLFLWLESVFFN